MHMLMFGNFTVAVRKYSSVFHRECIYKVPPDMLAHGSKHEIEYGFLLSVIYSLIPLIFIVFASFQLLELVAELDSLYLRSLCSSGRPNK